MRTPNAESSLGFPLGLQNSLRGIKSQRAAAELAGPETEPLLDIAFVLIISDVEVSSNQNVANKLMTSSRDIFPEQFEPVESHAGRTII